MSHRKNKAKTRCKTASPSKKVNRTMRTYKRTTNTKYNKNKNTNKNKKTNKNKNGGYLHNPGLGVVVGGLLGSS